MEGMKKEKSVKFTKSAEFFKNLQVFFLFCYHLFILLGKLGCEKIITKKEKMKSKKKKIKNYYYIYYKKKYVQIDF